MDYGFSEQEINEFKEDGLTPEEIEILEDAMASAATVAEAPEVSELSDFVKKYNEKIPDDLRKAYVEILDSAKTDPEFFKKLMALEMVMSYETGDKEPAAEPKTIITELSDSDYQKASEAYFGTLAKLNDKQRAEFLEMIKNLNEEQKKELLDRLLEK